MFAAVFILTTQYSFSQNLPKAKINHTAIYVVNLEASKYFYQHIIGLDTLTEPFKDGKHAWFKTGQGIAMHIIEGAPVKKEYYKNQHTCFSVASIALFTYALKKENICWEDRDGAKHAITKRVDGVQQIWLQDPDGYWVEINDDKN
ncbi:MAG: VOC family protein [Deinococcales bacterium]|nr:VOC family protein [Chitinophagaceae bacterium]